jgi:hypothetical protein
MKKINVIETQVVLQKKNNNLDKEINEEEARMGTCM